MKSAMRPFADGLDSLLASTVALIGVGSGVAVRVASVALETLTTASPGVRRGHTGVASGVLARALLVLTASALAWQRLEVLVALGSVARSDGLGAAVSVLADTDLRHLDVFERNAGGAFQAHEGWFAARPWRSAIGPLATDDQVRLAFAEADVLTGMLAVGPGRTRDLYAAGLSVPHRGVEARLVARTEDPRQRPSLCALFRVADSELDGRLADAYSSLTNGGLTSFRGVPLSVSRPPPLGLAAMGTVAAPTEGAATGA